MTHALKVFADRRIRTGNRQRSGIIYNTDPKQDEIKDRATEQ